MSKRRSPPPIRAYVALGFGSPGCMPNSIDPYAIRYARDIRDAILGQFNGERGYGTAMTALGMRRIWAHAKRFGLSSISLELPTGRPGEVLLFMGLTEDEYNAAIDGED